MCSIFGTRNFRTKLQEKITNLYRDRIRDFYAAIPEKEVKQLVKDKRYDLGKIIVSTAHKFWTAGEDEPKPAAERIIQMPCILTDFYEFREVFRKVLEEKELPEEERTYKPVKIPAYELIRDERDLLRIDLENRGLMVKDPLKCDRLIVKIFRYLEGEMDFKYGSDIENFGYRELALTPDQVYRIKKSGWEEFRNVAIDCEDMHHYAAACFKTAGMEGRYRLVVLQWEEGGETKMHLGLCVMDDTFERFRILELTPERRDLSRFISIRSFPVYGRDPDMVRPENVVCSYDSEGYYGSFKTFEQREPADDWIAKNITPERIEFPEEMFR